MLNEKPRVNLRFNWVDQLFSRSRKGWPSQTFPFKWRFNFKLNHIITCVNPLAVLKLHCGYSAGDFRIVKVLHFQISHRMSVKRSESVKMIYLFIFKNCTICTSVCGIVVWILTKTNKDVRENALRGIVKEMDITGLTTDYVKNKIKTIKHTKKNIH